MMVGIHCLPTADWGENISEELSKLGWPMSVSTGNCLDC